MRVPDQCIKFIMMGQEEDSENICFLRKPHPLISKYHPARTQDQNKKPFHQLVNTLLARRAGEGWAIGISLLLLTPDSHRSEETSSRGVISEQNRPVG